MLNDDIMGFANTSSREMFDHLCLSYDSITDVYQEHNFENMRKAWDPQQPAETLFKQIQDFLDFAEARGVSIGPSQQISVAYTNIFAT
jgi:hypothetical protein